ncbi:MAG: hypothetical protein KF715_16330 [Candidatus Didemnitutus sp.]|nr:hypothetical protein [Candidatus Didemnitutus sp.]
MAIAYRILPAQRLVHTWTDGALTDADLAAHRAQLLADPNFRPEFDQLVECLGAQPSSISQRGVSTSVTETVFSPKSRRAFVAVKDISFGVARMFALMQPPGTQVEVFRAVEPALRWLGQSPDAVTPVSAARGEER